MDLNIAKKNIFYSIAAQIVSLSVSFITGLIVPKFIPEAQYAYWQSYVLYVGYAGVFHFGLLDGIVLRFSQYDYCNLDKRRIRSHFFCLLALETVLALGLFVATRGLSSPESRRIFFFVAIGLISKNVFSYGSFLLQITNQISKYAKLVVVHRVIYGLLIVVFLAARRYQFEYFCLADLLSDFSATVICILLCKEAYFGKALPKSDAFADVKKSFSAGIKLMIANFCSMQLIGGAKMVIQWRWGMIVFGQIAFAFSLSSLFLTFISAISVVVFPSLKRLSKDEYPSFYLGLRRISTRFLFGALMLYFPGYVILSKWLPTYMPSLECWGILLPYIVFSARVGLLTNNYLKAYRKERTMLTINIVGAASAVLLYFVISYFLGNMTLVLLIVVGAIIAISIGSEVIVSREIGISLRNDFILDIAMSAIFFVSANFVGLGYGLLLYCVSYICYLVYDMFLRRNVAKICD